MSSCKELRRKGRQALGNSLFSSTWMFALLASLIVSAISTVSNMWLIVGAIVAGPLMVGSANYYLKLQNNEKPQISDLFYGFKNNFARNFGINLYYNLIVSCIAFGMVLLMLTTTYTIILIILTIVVFVMYVFIITIYTMRISILNFVLAENPQMRAFEARAHMLKLLRGYQLKSVWLSLSFIGWSFLANLTCGIGHLWLTPYIQSTCAAFYKELKRIKGVDTEAQAPTEEETQEEIVVE